MKKQKLSSLLPIAVFLIFYLGLGIWSEYIMKIPMGFYNIPIVVAFMLAILTACFQNRSLSFDRKLELMGQGIGDKNIITMLLIFLTAGTFVGVVGRSSAESVAYPGPFFRCCSLCGSVLCLYFHGNLRWNHHPDCSDCHCRI